MVLASGSLAAFHLLRWIACMVKSHDGQTFTTVFGSAVTTLVTMVLLVVVSTSMSALSSVQQHVHCAWSHRTTTSRTSSTARPSWIWPPSPSPITPSSPAPAHSPWPPSTNSKPSPTPTVMTPGTTPFADRRRLPSQTPPDRPYRTLRRGRVHPLAPRIKSRTSRNIRS